MSIRYSTRTTVLYMQERFDKIWLSGHGDAAIFDERSKGWYVVTNNGTHHFGPDKPDFKDGDTIKITYEKEQPAAEAAA